MNLVEKLKTAVENQVHDPSLLLSAAKHIQNLELFAKEVAAQSDMNWIQQKAEELTS